MITPSPTSELPTPPNHTTQRPTPEPTSPGTHLFYMRQCLELSTSSPPLSSNYRVGALLLATPSDPSVAPTTLSRGYTNELPGNTHAEQVCLSKLLSLHHGVHEDQLYTLIPENTTLYTTLEPCIQRLSGQKSCVDRILECQGRIATVVVGAREPGVFVKDNEGRRVLEENGVRVVDVEGLDEEILKVAMAGHLT